MGRIASKNIVRICLFISLLLAVGNFVEQVTLASGTGEGQIAYLRSGELYLFDLATNQTTQLTNDDNAVAIAWSPDGQRIAYEVMNSMVGCCGGSELLTDISIWTMKPDGSDRTMQATKETEVFPIAYAIDGALYHVVRITEAGKPVNAIVATDASGQTQQLYKEPGGLCHITDLGLPSAQVAVVSRDCGRGKYVSLVDLSTSKETLLGNDSCQRGGVLSGLVLNDHLVSGRIAATQTVCGEEDTAAKIAIFNSDGYRAHLLDTPDKSFGLVDWTKDSSKLVYGNEHGLWFVNPETGDATRLSHQGGVPRWWSDEVLPLPILDGGPGPAMPKAGQPQANDLLAWAALIACIVIVAGLVLISRRRRKGGDGL